MEFRLEIQGESHQPVLVVWGKLGIESHAKLEAKLDQLDASKAPALFVDLQQCPYLSSRIFPVLLKLQAKLEGEGRNLGLILTDELFEIFRITRLDRRLDLFLSREKAFRAFS